MRNTRDSYEEPSAWPSISDMMAGLMVMFLFIGLSFMLQNQDQVERLADQDQMLAEYDSRRHEIGQLMWAKIGHRLNEWQASLDTNTLRIRFQGKNTKFAPRSYLLTPGFKQVLDEFIPLFLAVAMDPMFEADIEEIRIEGHAFEDLTTTWNNRFTISQLRSRSVLTYLRETPYYQDLDPNQKAALNFRLSAVGMGDSRMIDQQGDYVFTSRREVCAPCSRRVEFTITTSSNRVLDQLRKSRSKE